MVKSALRGALIEPFVQGFSFSVALQKKEGVRMAESEEKDQGTATEQKEDVIETQDSGITDKEDVIEDENKDDARKDDEIIKLIGEMREELSGMKAQMVSMKDTVSQFIDAGAVIREDDITTVSNDDNTSSYQRIEDMDFSI